MTKSLINLIGTAMLGITALGCVNPRCREIVQPPEICAPVQAQTPAQEPPKTETPKEENKEMVSSFDKSKEDSKFGWKLSAYSSERVGDNVFQSGYHAGKFPSMTNDTGLTLENGRFSLTGWRYSIFSEGHNVEENYGISTTIKLTDKLSFLADIQQWEYGIRNTIGVLGASFNEKDWGAKFQTLHCFDDGGQLYYGNISRKFGEKVTLDLSAACSNNFLGSGKYGMQHITPGIKFKIGSLGPVDFSGDVEYQFGFSGQTDSFWYGAITGSIATPKIELKRK